MTPELSTHPQGTGYDEIWRFILEAMDEVDFKDRRVLDVGCRDGMFSFEAEKRGAREIVGIDNDLSIGATDFLIPFFKSKVRMYELNLNELSPRQFGYFGIILFFGVLYHLRYPFLALKNLVDCLSQNGLLVIESGMLTDRRFMNPELLYCPVESSPYDKTSCSFFNELGLRTTLHSFGCELLSSKTLMEKGKPLAFVRKVLKFGLKQIGRYERAPIKVQRQLLIFQKTTVQDTILRQYWNGTHTIHTVHQQKDKTRGLE